MTEYTVIERSRRIAAPPAAVLPLLTDFQRWAEWSPWEGMDPEQETRLSGEPSGVGAVYEWSGNRKVGQGRMEIMEVGPELVVIDLQFIKPFKSHNVTEFHLQPADGGAATDLVWRMRSPKTLSSRIFGLFMNMDKAIGKDLERGMQSLDSVIPR